MSKPEPTIQKTGRVGSPNANLTRWLRFLVAVFLTLLILWFITVLSFLRYLPSHEWLQAIEPYYMILGATAVVTTAVFLFLGFQTGQLQKAHREKKSSILVLPIVMAFLIYFTTTNLMRHGIPAMIAVGWGERVEHQFFILDPDEPGGLRGRCRREIVLRDMPFPINLCNMPPEFHDQLQPGMSVIFIGKGTWMGLFVEDFQKP